jgi:hypothetical protein
MEAVRAQRSRPAPPAGRHAPAAPLRTGAGPSTVLGLQREAGNAATGALLRKTGVLARCGAGGCTCGGKCGGHGKQEPDELELQRTSDDAGVRALARAVSARRKLA